MVIFFWDPMNPLPHDVDVKALLRMAVLYNVPIACNRSTADYLISSVLMDMEYKPVLKDYSEYTNRVMEDWSQRLAWQLLPRFGIEWQPFESKNC